MRYDNQFSHRDPIFDFYFLCMISFRDCPSAIEELALAELKFGTFSAFKVVGA